LLRSQFNPLHQEARVMGCGCYDAYLRAMGGCEAAATARFGRLAAFCAR
jgi:hypothetical protein